MLYYGIEMGGDFICERLNSLPSWTSNDIGRLVYLNTEQILYLGNSSTWAAVADASSIDHNSTINKQGGGSPNFYHLDSTSYDHVKHIDQYLDSTANVKFNIITANDHVSSPKITINYTGPDNIYPLHVDASGSTISTAPVIGVLQPSTGNKRLLIARNNEDPYKWIQISYNDALINNKPGITFGDGTAQPDVNIYRDSTDVLKTDNNFVVDGDLSLPTVMTSYGVVKNTSGGVLTGGNRISLTADVTGELPDVHIASAATWNAKQDSLGYAAEDQANKVTSVSGSSNDTEYPSAKLLYDEVNDIDLTTQVSGNLPDGNIASAATWNGKQDALGYTAENVVNKENTTMDTSTTKYPTNRLVKEYADGLVTGLLDYRGAYDASTNVWPSTGGSGDAGEILKGDMWIISTDGTLGIIEVQIGDSIIANADTPGQTDSNWDVLNSNISYVPEDQANKVTTINASSTDIEYPSAKAIYNFTPSGDYVPYTGANKEVDLGSQDIVTTGSGTFGSFYINHDSTGYTSSIAVTNYGQTEDWFRLAYETVGSDKQGIAFGDGTSIVDTTIYRESANVLRTDDTLIVTSDTKGKTAFKVTGTQGDLFEVIDDLDNILLSVNDISGLPVFEVFADDDRARISGSLEMGLKNVPATPAADNSRMYLYASGTTPNREIGIKMKLEDDEEIILCSALV